MSACQRCESKRIAYVSSKSSDCNGISIGDVDHDGYVPYDIGIGGGDYIDFDYCLDCGQIQNSFPLPLSKMESTE